MRILVPRARWSRFLSVDMGPVQSCSNFPNHQQGIQAFRWVNQLCAWQTQRPYLYSGPRAYKQSVVKPNFTRKPYIWVLSKNKLTWPHHMLRDVFRLSRRTLLDILSCSIFTLTTIRHALLIPLCVFGASWMRIFSSSWAESLHSPKRGSALVYCVDMIQPFSMKVDPLVARPRSDLSISTNFKSSSNSRFAFFISTGSEKRRDYGSAYFTRYLSSGPACAQKENRKTKLRDRHLWDSPWIIQV